MARRPHCVHSGWSARDPGDSLPGGGTASAPGLAQLGSFRPTPSSRHPMTALFSCDLAMTAVAHPRLALTGRPGRDRARPARAARSVVVPLGRPVTDVGAHRRRRRLDPLEAYSATHTGDL
jgi:hypothetical protein